MSDLLMEECETVPETKAVRYHRCLMRSSGECPEMPRSSSGHRLDGWKMDGTDPQISSRTYLILETQHDSNAAQKTTNAPVPPKKKTRQGRVYDNGRPKICRVLVHLAELRRQFSHTAWALYNHKHCCM